MKFCNKILTFSTLLLAFSIFADAQTYTERVAKDKEIAAGVYHPYHYEDLSDTPAPKGYTPFYISHYGRHGSRYHTSLRYFNYGEQGLRKAKEEGILNETGMQLYNDFFAVLKEHDGMEGELSPRGAREHRGIAERMYERFPQAFNSKDRKEVDCVSSDIPRCIISMANFTTKLKEKNPSLQFSFATGQRYFRYLAKSVGDKQMREECNHYEDSVRSATCHADKLMESIFTDKEKGIEAVSDPVEFCKSIAMVGSICQCLDFLNIDLFKYLDAEELAEQTAIRSDKFYGQFGNSKEYGQISSDAAKDLLRDFLKKADAALENGSGRAADLRFGHDTGILPFYGLIGLENYNVRRPMDGIHDSWTTYDRIPMGTNFQMVFYHNKKGDILVKLLNNEKETSIPALKTAVGPYYHWSELREYLEGLL